MARLLIQTAGLGKSAVELRMGINRIGRDRECEIHLPHASVSWFHAELALTSDGVHLTDCHSTNGTFLDGQPCAAAWLVPGQQLRFGSIETLVESTDAVIAIPQFERGEPAPAAPVILENGQTACRRHTETASTFCCPQCKELMCNRCVRVIRLKGRSPHYLCCLCSHPVERIEALVPKTKKSFFATLQETVLLKFKHPRNAGKK